MTGLKFYINDDGVHEYYDTRHYHSVVPSILMCDTSYLVPFCMNYESTGATIDNIVIEYFDEHELTLDSVLVFETFSDGDWDWIIYKEAEVESGAAALDTGLARIRIEMSDGDEFYSDYFMICDFNTSEDGDRIVYDDYFNIYFSATCDFSAGYRIIYQTGYENHHTFDTLPVMPDSNYVAEGETDEAQNEYYELQSRKKNYRVEIIGGESLFDMMAVLPLHEYVHVCWPGMEMQQARNIEFEPDWIDDYLCRIIIHFSIVNLKKGGCDTDFDFGYNFARMMGQAIVKTVEGDHLTDIGGVTQLKITGVAGDVLTLDNLPEEQFNTDYDWFCMSYNDYNMAEPGLTGDYTVMDKVASFNFTDSKVTLDDATGFNVDDYVGFYSPWVNYEAMPGQTARGIIKASDIAWVDKYVAAGPVWEYGGIFYMAFYGRNSTPNVRTFLASSLDFETWTVLNGGNAIITNADDAGFAQQVHPSGNALSISNTQVAFCLNGRDGSGNTDVYVCVMDKDGSNISWDLVIEHDTYDYGYGAGLAYDGEYYHIICSEMHAALNDWKCVHFRSTHLTRGYTQFCYVKEYEYLTNENAYCETYTASHCPFIENGTLYCLLQSNSNYNESMTRGNGAVGLWKYDGGWAPVNDFTPEIINPMYFDQIASEDYDWAGGHIGGYISFVHYGGQCYMVFSSLRIVDTYQIFAVKLRKR